MQVMSPHLHFIHVMYSVHELISCELMLIHQCAVALPVTDAIYILLWNLAICAVGCWLVKSLITVLCRLLVQDKFDSPTQLLRKAIRPDPVTGAMAKT